MSNPALEKLPDGCFLFDLIDELSKLDKKSNFGNKSIDSMFLYHLMGNSIELNRKDYKINKKDETTSNDIRTLGIDLYIVDDGEANEKSVETDEDYDEPWNIYYTVYNYKNENYIIKHYSGSHGTAFITKIGKAVEKQKLVTYWD